MSRTHKLSRILIVDDEPANLKLLDKMLCSQGYESLDLVSDPREVISRYQAACPDLIRENSGKHFDPSLVEIFLRELPRIVAIREQFSEPEAE